MKLFKNFKKEKILRTATNFAAIFGIIFVGVIAANVVAVGAKCISIGFDGFFDKLLGLPYWIYASFAAAISFIYVTFILK